MSNFDGKNNKSTFSIGNMSFTSTNCRNVTQGINMTQYNNLDKYVNRGFVGAIGNNVTTNINVINQNNLEENDDEVEEAIHLSIIDQIGKIQDEKEDNEALQCKICFDNRIVVTFNPCGDFKSCASCVLKRLNKKQLNCPFCNQKIDKYTKTFI